jgi:hypothetical protein
MIEFIAAALAQAGEIEQRLATAAEKNVGRSFGQVDDAHAIHAGDVNLEAKGARGYQLIPHATKTTIHATCQPKAAPITKAQFTSDSVSSAFT